MWTFWRLVFQWFSYDCCPNHSKFSHSDFKWFLTKWWPFVQNSYGRVSDPIWKPNHLQPNMSVFPYKYAYVRLFKVPQIRLTKICRTWKYEYTLPKYASPKVKYAHICLQPNLFLTVSKSRFPLYLDSRAWHISVLITTVVLFCQAWLSFLAQQDIPPISKSTIKTL